MPIFPIFVAKKIFPENLALSRKTSHEILAPCQISQKTNIIPRKWLDRRKDGRTDRPLFYGTLSATARGPKSDFYEPWQQHKQLKTMEMSEAWTYTYDEGYYTSVPTWTHSQNLLAAETLNFLKTSSKRTKDILSENISQMIMKTATISTSMRIVIS